ncbi:alpha/beta hydrolase [Cryobacterium melibiosiphilum]|nr:alpha/beta hydrolase [Cryobacterium melibiosiphilum]
MPTVSTAGIALPEPVPVQWYRPTPVGRPSLGPTVLWLHGGGFFRGSLDQPEAHAVAQSLAGHGLSVATVGYRLAPTPGLSWMKTRASIPRGRFPLPLDDVLAAYRSVSAQSPGGVILGGASAGACLAAAAALRATDEGWPPVGAVLAYGFFHAAHRRTADVQQRATGHRRITHAVWALNAMNRNYAGSRTELNNRLAFPGGHDLHEFPRTLSINAEKDNMRASGDAFASELVDVGVEVQRHVLPGTRHAFLNRPGTDAFATAVSLIAEWSLGE